jgi:hypothetical protein
MNAMTGNYLPAEMRASDSDRDAVVSDLSEHFQAGRLTAEEFDERTGRALPARTWGELGDLLADLPSTQLGPPGPGQQVLAAPAEAVVRALRTASDRRAGRHRDRCRRAGKCGPRRVGFHLAPPLRAVHSAALDPLR